MTNNAQDQHNNRAKSSDGGEEQPPGMMFPCIIDIKVFVKTSQDMESRVRKILRGTLSDDQIVEISSRESRKGNYHSLSCRVDIKSRDQADAVFQLLSSHPDILMVI